MTETALCLSTPICGKGERYVNKETPMGRANGTGFLAAYFLHLAVCNKTFCQETTVATQSIAPNQLLTYLWFTNLPVS